MIPSRKGSCWSDQTNVSILNKEVMNEDIDIRVLLLPPPGYGSAWEKSIIDIHSHSGTVIVEVASCNACGRDSVLIKPLIPIDSISGSRKPPFSDVRYIE